MNVLFLCPHGAAKSVFAKVYFADMTRGAGLDVTVSNAGTEPDPVVNRKVEAYLRDEGFDVSGFVPPLLTDGMLDTADLVVSIGCITAEQLPPDTQYRDWSDIPMLSADFQASRNAIYTKVEQLVKRLSV